MNSLDEDKEVISFFKRNKHIRISVETMMDVEIQMIHDVLYAITNRVSTVHDGHLVFIRWVDEK